MIAPEPATTDADFALEVPSRRNRLTVAFRIVLAIPHFVALIVVGIGAALAVIAGWFAALVLGRLPAAIARFAVRWIAYVTRFNAYLWLLTDRYPRFALEDPDQPVEPDHPVRAAFAPTPLNRLAVLFRIIIGLPAYLLTVFVSTGLWFVGFIAWLIILFTGRLPSGLYNAIAVIVRYLARFYAYMGLVTGIYPSGLLGDRPRPPGPPQAYDEPVLEEMPVSTTEVRDRFVLGGGAKAIVVVAVILGLAGQGGAAALRALNTDYIIAHTEFVELVEEFEDRVDGYFENVRSCRGPGCVRRGYAEVADEVDRFVTELGDIAFPDGVRSKVLGVTLSALEFRDAFQRVADARTARQLRRALRVTTFERVGSSFDDSVNGLVAALEEGVKTR